MTPDPIEAVAFFLKTARHDRDCLAVKGVHYGDESCDCGLVAARAAIAAMPKVEALAADNARLRKAVDRAAFIFATYAAVHRGKNTEGAEAKAASNEALAEEMRAAITPEPDTTGGAR